MYRSNVISTTITFIKVFVVSNVTGPHVVSVRREEIREDKIHRKSFLNSLKEIAQRSKFRGSENAVRIRPDKVWLTARSTGMHDAQPS